MVIPGGPGVQIAAGYARVMNADGSFTTIEVRAGDTSDEARRPILISERLSVEEMAPTVRDDDGMTIVAGGFHGHTAQIGTWVGPDGLHLDESEPAPPAPHSAEPVRYVAYRVVRFGHESHGALNAGPRTVDASDGEVEQLCRAMLSELLCGVDGDTAAAVRFAHEPASYRTIVGRFPPHHDGERHGMFLLMLTEGLRQIRVVGQCQTYRQAHSYDATALAIVPTSDIWFTDEAEMVARRTARALMRGAPALYAISETGAGFRGAYEVNTREENSELELSAAEQFIVRQLAQQVDRRRAAQADQVWASAGPMVWPRLSKLVDEAEEAATREEMLCDELWQCDLVDNLSAHDEAEDAWIFREDIPYGQLVRHTIFL